MARGRAEGGAAAAAGRGGAAARPRAPPSSPARPAAPARPVAPPGALSCLQRPACCELADAARAGGAGGGGRRVRSGPPAGPGDGVQAAGPRAGLGPGGGRTRRPVPFAAALALCSKEASRLMRMGGRWRSSGPSGARRRRHGASRMARSARRCSGRSRTRPRSSALASSPGSLLLLFPPSFFFFLLLIASPPCPRLADRAPVGSPATCSPATSPFRPRPSPW